MWWWQLYYIFYFLLITWQADQILHQGFWILHNCGPGDILPKIPEKISPNNWSIMPDCIPNYLNSILNYINIKSVFALGLLSPGTHVLSHHLLAFIHSTQNHWASTLGMSWYPTVNRTGIILQEAYGSKWELSHTLVWSTSHERVSFHLLTSCTPAIFLILIKNAVESFTQVDTALESYLDEDCSQKPCSSWP